MLNVVRVHGERLQIGVHEHWQGIIQKNRIDRRDESVRCDQDFIAWAYAEYLDRRMERIGAARRHHAAACANLLRPGLFKLGNEVPLVVGAPSMAAERLEHVLLILFVGLGPIRKGPCPDRSTALQSQGTGISPYGNRPGTNPCGGKARRCACQELPTS